jgi:hypothetical protein
VDAVDRFGYLPLHYAVSANAPVAMVESLIDMFPLGPSVPDASGNVALHLAVDSGASAALARTIYLAYPAAVTARNSAGQLPLQLLAERIANGHTYDVAGIGDQAQWLAFPINCNGQADNWFYLLQAR